MPRKYVSCSFKNKWKNYKPFVETFVKDLESGDKSIVGTWVEDRISVSTVVITVKLSDVNTSVTVTITYIWWVEKKSLIPN